MQDNTPGCFSALAALIATVLSLFGISTQVAMPVEPPPAVTFPVVTLAPYTVGDPVLNPCTNAPFRVIATNAALKSAEATQDPNMVGYRIDIAFNSEHPEAQAFAAFTAENIGQVLAIALNDRVIMTPVIQSRIEADAGVVISTNFSQVEATQLAAQLLENTAKLTFVDFSIPAGCSAAMPEIGAIIITDQN